MSRLPAAILLLLAFLSACHRTERDKHQVEQAILDRLQTHSGLDLNALDVSTTDVRFDKNLAYATVSFHPKGDARLSSEMVMRYTLQDNDDKWVVVRVGDSRGNSLSHGHDGLAGGALPPGHPDVNAAPQPMSGGTQ